MASYCHTPERDETPTLDKILKNTEFENTQQAKAIETEREKIQAYWKQLDEKVLQTKNLGEATQTLDDHLEQLNKQFQLNRENYESLKRTLGVLDEHKEALHRKLKSISQEAEQERAQHEQALLKYGEVWATYQAKYEAFPMTKELSRRLQDIQIISEQNATLESQVKDVELLLSELQLEKGVEDMVSWVLQIANLQENTKNQHCALKLMEEDAECLQGEAVVLRQRNDKARVLLEEQNLKRQKMAHVGYSNNSTGALQACEAMQSKPLCSNTDSCHASGASGEHIASYAETQIKGSHTLTVPQMPSHFPLLGATPPCDRQAGLTPRNGTCTSLPSSKERGNERKIANTAGSNKFMLEIPQLSVPSRNITAATQHIPENQHSGKSLSNSVLTRISHKQPKTARVQLHIPTLQTPARPQCLPMSQSKNASKSSVHLTMPTMSTEKFISKPQGLVLECEGKNSESHCQPSSSSEEEFAGRETRDDFLVVGDQDVVPSAGEEGDSMTGQQETAQDMEVSLPENTAGSGNSQLDASYGAQYLGDSSAFDYGQLGLYENAFAENATMTQQHSSAEAMEPSAGLQETASEFFAGGHQTDGQAGFFYTGFGGVAGEGYGFMHSSAGTQDCSGGLGMNLALFGQDSPVPTQQTQANASDFAFAFSSTGMTPATQFSFFS